MAVDGSTGVLPGLWPPHLPPPTLTPHPQLRIYTFACHHAPCTMHHATMHHAPCHHSMPPCHPYLPRLCDCWLHTYFSGGFARWLGMFNVCFWTPGMGVFELRNAKRLWFRYLNTPFLTHSVQRYACLGRHPRTHTMFFGTVQFKNPHPRYPKTPLLPYGVQWYWCLGRHPRTQVCMQPTLAQPR